MLLSTIFLGACQESAIVDNSSKKNAEAEAPEVIQGVLNIKVSESFAKQLEDKTLTTKSGCFSTIDATSLERIFPYAGKFEERTRKEGLHLWYRVIFDNKKEISATKADLTKMDGIDFVESIPQRKLAYTPIFNDPRYPTQWHYFNDGSPAKSIVGCDMNVLPVWEEFTTGSDEVIVSVVDQGVDYDHEDLKDNMWVNEAEFNGKKGVDDDGNGYKDDIYGYNFMPGRKDITPGDHGTHVAGTISAVNNNGIGVSGIAGGDASKGIKGVRIMSCQIGEGIQLIGDDAAAIKYGADNGAVISQNSWGSEAHTISYATKAAVDYFIKYAGIDENGNQVGPMKGGLVIFAAGNEDRPARSPGNYAPILCVSSVRADFQKSYFSCYGDGVDVAAPGGDIQYRNHGIISSVVNDRYDSYQGTSMACPHVSGLAALLVSHFGKEPGLTPSEVEDRILRFVTPIDEYNDEKYYLGTGLINAYKAFVGEGVVPEAITDLEVDAVSNTLPFTFTVPTDEDDETLAKVAVYYSEDEFTDINAGMDVQIFDISGVKTGETYSNQLDGLQFEKEYYVAAVVYDKNSNRSKLSNIVKIASKANSLPVITPENGTEITMKAHETKSMSFKIKDQDGHTMRVALIPHPKGVNIERNVEDAFNIIIEGKKQKTGANNIIIRVTDAFGASSDLPIVVNVLKNTPPEKIKELDNMLFTSKDGAAVSFNINDYVNEPDGEKLMVQIFRSVEDVVDVQIGDDGQISVSPLKYGAVNMTFTALDGFARSVDLNVKVLVRDGSKPVEGAFDVDVYPNPVVKDIFVRTMETKDATVKVYSVSGACVAEAKQIITPFEPAKLNLSSIAGGTYSVVVEAGGEKVSRQIVKL